MWYVLCVCEEYHTIGNCSVCNGRKDADMVQWYWKWQDRWWQASTWLTRHIHYWWQCVSYRYPIRDDRHLKLALFITNWMTEKCVHAGCQTTSQMISKLVIWNLHPYILHIVPIKQCTFCSAVSQGKKHGLIMQCLKPKKASMMRKHPSSPPAKF